jgi:hypothetical protein
MARKYESANHIDDVTQAKVLATIRYLDPDLSSANGPEDYGVAIAIGALVVILAIWVLIHIWLCPWRYVIF